MKATALLSILAIAITGCATSYKTNGLGGGFKETALAPDIYRVTFSGNGYTSPERAKDFALLRACELCLRENYAFFAVMDENSDTRNIVYSTPSTSTTQGILTPNGAGAIYRGTTTTQPGLTTQIRLPSTGLMVKFFKTKPATESTVFDAAWLQGSLKKQYAVE